jgi:hypothetical protein
MRISTDRAIFIIPTRLNGGASYERTRVALSYATVDRHSGRLECRGQATQARFHLPFEPLDVHIHFYSSNRTT